MPSEPDRRTQPTSSCETRDRVRAAIQSLPWRERKVIGLYYYGEVTMKHIGAEIGVNESRVSQLHARAIRRLRDALGDMNPQKVAEMRRQLIAFAAKQAMAKAAMVQMKANPSFTAETAAHRRRWCMAFKPTAKKPAPVKASLRMPRQRQADRSGSIKFEYEVTKYERLAHVQRSYFRLRTSYYVSVSRTARSKSPSLNGFASQRQPLSSRNCSASVPATSPVTKITRFDSPGAAADSVR